MTWVPCPLCDEWLCTLHQQHVSDCPCPPVEEWTTDPYDDGRATPDAGTPAAAEGRSRRVEGE